MARIKAVCVTLFALVLTLMAVYSASYDPQIKHVHIVLPHLPQRSDGLRILQISDIHIGGAVSLPFVEKLVGTILEISPDMLIITGDFADGWYENLKNRVEPFSKIDKNQIKYGIFFVTGNHEYVHGHHQDWITVMKEWGIRTLRNELVHISDDTSVLFDLAGVDDYTAHLLIDPNNNPYHHGADITAAVRGHLPSTDLILLAHQPKHIYEASEHGVTLQISGHTHAGQMWPVDWLAWATNPFLEGLSKYKSTFIYVSSGTAWWGPPMRLFTQSEITVFHLHSPTQNT